MGSLLYWPAAVLLMAWAQGKLLPAIRRTPPGREAQLQALALHYVLGVGYLLPLTLAPTLLGAGVALASRLLLFDPVLNTSAGEPAFAVGATALTDRALRWGAARLSWKPERLRLVVWVVSLVAACYLLVISYKLRCADRLHTWHGFILVR